MNQSYFFIPKEMIKYKYYSQLLFPTNQIKYIRIHCSSKSCRLRMNLSISFIPKEMIKFKYYSQELDLRITFASLSKNTTFEFYNIQPKSMLEWKLIKKKDKNPKFIRVFDRQNSSNSIIREYCQIDLSEYFI